MNKAFTKESDDAWEPVPELKDPLPKGVKNYVTPLGAEALRKTLAELAERRSALLAIVNSGGTKTAEPSALPPRQQLDELDRRLRFFTERVRTMVVVDPTQHEGSIVRFGARVVVDDGSGELVDYSIVGVDEADPGVGKISFLSPIAKALMGRGEGDEVEVELPAGVKSLDIVSIAYG